MSRDTLNFLVFTSDEHNPMISSVYGHPFIRTPNMQRLAEMGTVYENAYCPSPLCCPSRSAFFTGRRVHDIQTYNNCITDEFEYPSYGQVLAEQGVHTVHIGKVHAYRKAKDLGFSEMHGKDARFPGDLNIGRKPLAIRSLETPNGGTRDANYGVRENPTEIDDGRVQRAVEWIRTKGATIKKPWSLAVNTSKPHFPMFSTQRLWDIYAEHEDMPEYGFDSEPAKHAYARDLQAHFQTTRFPEKSIRGLRRGYYSLVAYVDFQLGRILDALEETGLTDNTVIAYTSDHGEMLGKFGMWWKCTLYEGSARVPLIIAGPGFKKHHRIKTPVDQLDLQASIFRSLGCKRPDTWSGTHLQDIGENSSDHVAFCEYHGHGTRAGAYMIRKRNWKLIYYCEAENQLFNVTSDPDEQNNVVERFPEIAAELEGELRRICSPEDENRRAEEFIKHQLEAIDKMNLVVQKGGLAELA